jgi:hypothetical protein
MWVENFSFVIFWLYWVELRASHLLEVHYCLSHAPDLMDNFTGQPVLP